jgi:hypothetical protein
MYESPSPKTATGWGYILLALLLLFGDAFAAQPKAAAESKLTDSQMRANMLVKFLQYGTWPSERVPKDKGEWVIGVFGDDEFLREVEAAAHEESARQAHARQEVAPKDSAKKDIRRIRVLRLENLAMAQVCHIVFVSATESRSETEWFSTLKGRAVLTVGDSETAIRRGATMSFVQEGESVLFEANQRAAVASRIELDARLLAMAIKPRSRTRIN